MRLALLTGGILAAVLGATAARADQTSGEIQVDARRIPSVRSLATSLSDAEEQAGDVKIAQFLAVLPLADGDSARLDAAYPDGLHAGCSGGTCTLDGNGNAATAPLTTSDPGMKGVSVGLKTSIAGTYKVTKTDAGQTVSVCGVSGVYFSKLIFRLNLINFQFVDNGGDSISARYELQGATSQISCD